MLDVGHVVRFWLYFKVEATGRGVGETAAASSYFTLSWSVEKGDTSSRS